MPCSVQTLKQLPRLCLKRGLTLSGEAKNTCKLDSPPKGQTPFETKPSAWWQVASRFTKHRLLDCPQDVDIHLLVSAQANSHLILIDGQFAHAITQVIHAMRGGYLTQQTYFRGG